MRDSHTLAARAAAMLLVVGCGLVHEAAAQDKTARGTATAVTNVSLTIKAGDRDLTFDVDNRTVVRTRPSGSLASTTQTIGSNGVKLTSLVQSGQTVVVTYRDADGRSVATEIARTGSTDRLPPKIAAGTVKSVTATSLVVTAEGKNTTFMIDPDTIIIGSRSGGAMMDASVSVTSLVAPGDSARVSYRPTRDGVRAVEIRVTAKAQ